LILASPFISLGQIAAIFGAVLFSVSFILASRTYLVEEACGGLDRAYRLHHKTGAWSTGFIAVHFLAVSVGYAANGIPVVKLFTSNFIYIAGGLGLLTMAGIAVTIIYFKIPYKYFTLIQKFFAIPFAFGIFHLLFITSDISRYQPLRIFVLVIVALGAAAWIYRELFYRYLGPQAVYIVNAINDKGAGVLEISLTPKNDRLKFKPGQFAYFSFHSKSVSAEAHPFSFTSAPNDNELRFAAKQVGDFTDELGKLAAGDEATVFGPYGKFFSEFTSDAGSIFIAGGIGITPFLSALRGKVANDKTIFFCSTHSDNDCVYAGELKTLSEAPKSFKLHLHESDRRGHLTADIVEKRADGLKGKKIFICGPEPMMNTLKKQFLAKNVPAEDIIFEQFNY